MVGRIRFESTLKSLRVVRFGSIARGAQRTTCSRIPLSSWQFVRNRKPAVDEAAARSPGALACPGRNQSGTGSLPIARSSPGQVAWKVSKISRENSAKSSAHTKRVPHGTLGTSWRSHCLSVGFWNIRTYEFLIRMFKILKLLQMLSKRVTRTR